MGARKRPGRRWIVLRVVVVVVLLLLLWMVQRIGVARVEPFEGIAKGDVFNATISVDLSGGIGDAFLIGRRENFFSIQC